MSQLTSKAFEKNIQDMLTAIELLNKHKLIVSCMINVYSTIDTLAWLARPKSKQNSSRQDFINWVERYLLPNLDIACTSIDLYAARCSIVHSYSFESDLTRKSQAKQIWYSWGIASTKPMNVVIAKRNVNAVALHVDDLIFALKKALSHFFLDIKKNSSLKELVYKRASQYFFSNIPVRRAGLG